MSKRNDDFMEIYKRIDAFCRDAYQVEKGLTTYIDKMKEISDGSRYVSGWDLTLRRLIDYRHIRNNYAHEVGSTAMDICEETDIEWLKRFYKSLMDAQDPLAAYRKAKQPVQNKQPRKEAMPSKVQSSSYAAPQNEYHYYRPPATKKKESFPAEIIAVFIIVFLLVAIVAVLVLAAMLG